MNNKKYARPTLKGSNPGGGGALRIEAAIQMLQQDECKQGENHEAGHSSILQELAVPPADSNRTDPIMTKPFKHLRVIKINPCQEEYHG
jgi:hypothetical protein